LALYTEPFTAVLDNVWPKIQWAQYHSKENTLTLWLKEHCNSSFTSSGEYFRVPISYGHTDDSTTFVSGYEPISTTAIVDQDHIRLGCGNFALPIIGSNYEIEVKVGNDANRVYDYWLSKTQTRAKAATRILEGKLLGNEDGTLGTVCGLDYAVDQTDTSYCGQTRSATNTYGLWPVEDTTTTSYTHGAMVNMIMDLRQQTDVVITSKDIFGFIMSYYQPQERYNKDNGAGDEFRKVGAAVQHILDIPVTWSERLGEDFANHMYLLSAGDGNEKHILYFTHSKWDLGAEKVMDRTKDQEVKVGRIKWAGQLMVPGGQFQGRFTGITS